MQEIWKDIKGYEGLYQVSNLGRIKSFHKYRTTNRIMKPRLKRGYYQIGLRKDSKRKWYSIHRLVAQAFILNSNNYPIINHKDGNKLNNNVDNLEWCTYSYNSKEAIRLGLAKPPKAIKGELNPNSKKIIQYDKNMNKIKIWGSIADASRELNICSCNIIECCKKHRLSAGNYIWEYLK